MQIYKRMVVHHLTRDVDFKVFNKMLKTPWAVVLAKRSVSP
jgi:TPP-dependent 2-oxoacid decarboxylase